MTGEPISTDTLLQLFEAARFAPSSYNEQPWHFVYATKDSEHWDAFFNVLVEGNQKWCANAGALVCALSKKTFDRNDKPNTTAQFSVGSAFENIALQGTAMNLVVHGMGGFDKEKAREVMSVPENYDVVMMFAVGNPGEVEQDTISNRKKVSEFISEGTFST